MNKNFEYTYKKLNYKSFGEGTTIIILHGLFGMLDNWQSIAKKLAEDYQIILVDQRDHGRSPHSQRFNYDILAQDIFHFSNDLGLNRFHLLGHSMGGKTAMKFAQNFPDRLQSMIAVDISPKTYKGGHETIFEAILGIDLSKIDSRKAVDLTLMEQIPDVGVRLFLMKNLTRNPEGGFKWKANFPLLQKSYPDIMAGFEEAFTCPIESLFISGGDSDYIQVKDYELISDFFPNVRFETIDGAGHWVHAQKPKELLTILKDFLSRFE